MPFDPKLSAGANSQGRRDRVTALCQDPAIADFHAHAETAKVSINVDGQKLAANVARGRMLSSFEHELDRASSNRVEAEANYAAAQKSYLPRRRVFESAFAQTDQMLYGVANSGNAGTLGKYGQFCVVIEVSAANADDTYVIPSNSLGDAKRPDGYVDLSNVLKEVELANDIAMFADLAHVVTEECATTCGAVAQPEWPSVVCGGDHALVEVLMASEPVTSVVEIRIRQQYADFLNHTDREARRMGKTWVGKNPTVHELNGFRTLVGSGQKVVTVS
jgi:hypothetical protein